MTLLALSQRIKSGAFRPILPLYPCSQQNGKNRSFHKEWYNDHDWLEYSPSLVLAYCFPCRAFKGNEINSSRTDETFSKSGFKGWHRANKSFLTHKLSKSHLNSTIALSAFLNSKPIDQSLDHYLLLDGLVGLKL